MQGTREQSPFLPLTQAVDSGHRAAIKRTNSGKQAAKILNPALF